MAGFALGLGLLMVLCRFCCITGLFCCMIGRLAVQFRFRVGFLDVVLGSCAAWRVGSCVGARAASAGKGNGGGQKGQVGRDQGEVARRGCQVGGAREGPPGHCLCPRTSLCWHPPLLDREVPYAMPTHPGCAQRERRSTWSERKAPRESGGHVTQALLVAAVTWQGLSWAACLGR